MTKSWTVTLEQDHETGDLVLPLTPDMLSQVGWDFGDVLEWHDNNDGTWSIMKKQKLSPKFHEMALAVGGSHYPEVGGELLQKFGEMVVRECINAAIFKNDGMISTADVAGHRAAGRAAAAQMIREHFGIEE